MDVIPIIPFDKIITIRSRETEQGWEVTSQMFFLASGLIRKRSLLNKDISKYTDQLLTTENSAQAQHQYTKESALRIAVRKY